MDRNDLVVQYFLALLYAELTSFIITCASRSFVQISAPFKRLFLIFLVSHLSSPIICRHSEGKKHLSNSFSLNYGENNA